MSSEFHLRARSRASQANGHMALFRRSAMRGRAMIAALGLLIGAGDTAFAQHRMGFGPPPAPAAFGDWSLQPDAPKLSITVTPRRAAASGHLVCVRTCDGYYFPVSAGGGSDRSVAEFMCQASCPGATTKVFTRRGEEIDNAVGSDKSLYRKLAAALSFRKALSPSCSCHRPGALARSGPVYDDPTLRPGDAIVVNGRAVVFKGGTRPYSERDFVALEQSALPSEARASINARLLLRPSSVATAAKRSQTRLASTANGVQNGATARTAGVTGSPRVVLPHPFDFDTLPASVSAFAPER